MSRLEKIVFGKAGTRIAIIIGILWVIGFILLCIKNITEAYNMHH